MLTCFVLFVSMLKLVNFDGCTWQLVPYHVGICVVVLSRHLLLLNMYRPSISFVKSIDALAARGHSALTRLVRLAACADEGTIAVFLAAAERGSLSWPLYS